MAAAGATQCGGAELADGLVAGQLLAVEEGAGTCGGPSAGPRRGFPAAGRWAGVAAALGVLLLAAPALLLGARWAHGVPGPETPAALARVAEGEAVELIGQDAALDGILCAVDVSQAMWRLANAATAIKAATAACKDVQSKNDNAKAGCSIAVNGIIQNMIFVAVTVSGAVSSCAGKVDEKAACTSGVTQFLAGLDVMAGSATEVTQACNLWWKSVPVPPVGVTTKFPLLPPTPPPVPRPTLPPLPTPGPLKGVPSALWFDNNRKSLYQTNIVNCWITTGQGFTFLIRAALALFAATKTCPASVIAAKGGKKCAISILALIATLNLATRFLSLTVPTCGGLPLFGGSGNSNGARCAAGIAGLTASVFVVTAPAVAFNTICDPKITGLDPAEAIPELGDNRRLSELRASLADWGAEGEDADALERLLAQQLPLGNATLHAAMGL